MGLAVDEICTHEAFAMVYKTIPFVYSGTTAYILKNVYHV